jgi:hypothetical protein
MRPILANQPGPTLWINSEYVYQVLISLTRRPKPVRVPTTCPLGLLSPTPCRKKQRQRQRVDSRVHQSHHQRFRAHTNNEKGQTAADRPGGRPRPDPPPPPPLPGGRRPRAPVRSPRRRRRTALSYGLFLLRPRFTPPPSSV